VEMKGTHLTLKYRKFIQHGLEEGISKAQIARELGKGPSTISKEIRQHRRFKYRDGFVRDIAYFRADRGTEFSKNELFEINSETGEIRSDIFYCDSQMPSQKPHVENNHNYVRNIIPNGKKLKNLT
ncbi:MAG: helix-turn-helix domain-containing protein, partial [Clostridia bacterium]|nr:helix-turn-helix domain-containing protein [Clostridia bacterium]